MSGIVLSAAVRQNLLSLQNTAASLATTQNNLSTGKKVNTALDNPTNFFTASGLDNRASDISNLLDGISNGVQVLQAANTGITSLQSLVSQAKSIANQALQSAIGYSAKSSFTSAAVSGATSNNILGTAFASTTIAGSTTLTQTGSGAGAVTGATSLDATGSAVDEIAGPAAGTSLTINGQVINFTTSTTTSASATGNNIDINTGTLQNVVDAINTITGNLPGPNAGAAVASIVSGKLQITTGTAATGVTIGGSAAAALGLATVTAGGTPAASGAYVGSAATVIPLGQTLVIPTVGTSTTPTTITFGTGAGQVSTLDQLNKALAANNLQATQNITTGALTIQTTNDAASSTIGSLGGSAVTTTGAFFSADGASGAGAPVAPVVDTTSQTARANLVSQYNAILTQIDNTAADSSYNGINLLSGDQLQLTFNETGKSKVNITGVQFNSAGLGLSALSTSAFEDNNATNSVLTTLNSVSTTLRSQASAFGSNLSVVQTRQDFNKNLINVLQTGSANLTQADINEEAANSQALSTRQSLSVSALSLANQAQQSVLQLLR